MLEVTHDDVVHCNNNPVAYKGVLGARRQNERTRRGWPAMGVPYVAVRIDGGSQALYTPHLPMRTGWMNLGYAPRPSSRREHFIHDLAHGVLMHYPLRAVLGFALKGLFTKDRLTWRPEPENDSESALRVIEPDAHPTYGGSVTSVRDKAEEPDRSQSARSAQSARARRVRSRRRRHRQQEAVRRSERSQR